MIFSDYLTEMGYAVTRVIESLWHEHSEAKRLRTEIDELRQVAAYSYPWAQFMQQHAEDADDLLVGVH